MSELTEAIEPNDATSRLHVERLRQAILRITTPGDLLSVASELGRCRGEMQPGDVRLISDVIDGIERRMHPR